MNKIVIFFIIFLILNCTIFSIESYMFSYKEIELRENPEIKSKVVKKIEKGEKLTLLEESTKKVNNKKNENWIKVRITDESEGWCFKHDIREKFYLDKIGMNLICPLEYQIRQSNEVNRRGSVVTYEIKKLSNVTSEEGVIFSEIQFFTKDSIKRFNENEEFEGDYPNVERYEQQKKVFKVAKKNDYYSKNEKEYGSLNKLIRLGNKKYFVHVGHYAAEYYTEYTMFINDLKIDIWFDKAEPYCENKQKFIEKCNEILIQVGIE